MYKSDTIGKLAEALCKVQATLKPAKADSENPYFKSHYADLASVWDAIREPLSKNGLAIVQTLGGTTESVEVTTTLVHTSGEWISGTLALKPVKNDPQASGSAISYGRRYGISACCGIVQGETDDDGNAASGKGNEKNENAPIPPPAKQTEKKADNVPDARKDTDAIYTAEVVLGKVETQHGKGAKGAWTRYYAQGDDGEYYSTFDHIKGGKMVELAQAGDPVLLNYRIKVTTKGTSRDIVDIIVATPPDEKGGDLDAELDRGDTQRHGKDELPM